jgi:hypothetical protein
VKPTEIHHKDNKFIRKRLQHLAHTYHNPYSRDDYWIGEYRQGAENHPPYGPRKLAVMTAKEFVLAYGPRKLAVIDN